MANNRLHCGIPVVVASSLKKANKSRTKKRLNQRAILRFLDPVIDRNINKLIKNPLHNLISRYPVLTHRDVKLTLEKLDGEGLYRYNDVLISSGRQDPNRHVGIFNMFT